jgi:Tfp pilus assembly protein PilO
MKPIHAGWVAAALGLLASAALGLAVYTLILLPAIAENVQQRQRINSKEALLKRVQLRTQRWTEDAETLQLEAAEAKRKLQTLRRKQAREQKNVSTRNRVPSLVAESELSKIKVAIEKSADTMGIEITSLTRDKDIRDGRITYAVINVLLTGTYSQLTDWISSATLADARICEARSITLKRLTDPTDYFNRPAVNRTARLELSATLFCAALGKRGTIPTIEHAPYPDNDSWSVLKKVYVKSLTGTVQRAPFTPYMYRYYGSPNAASAPSEPKVKNDIRPINDPVSDAEKNSRDSNNLTNIPTTVDDPKPNPLTSAPVEDYAVLAIIERSGIRTAVVMLPDGRAQAARLDMRIGSEGGFVADITKDGLIVDIPTRSKPIKLLVKE